MKAWLYTTLGCHLCDQALAMLNHLAAMGLGSAEAEMAIETVEIADSPWLLESYGLRIPVVRAEGRSDELGWPFTLEELKAYLEGR